MDHPIILNSPGVWPRLPAICGRAGIDFRETSFAVSVRSDAFVTMGCSAWGRVMFYKSKSLPLGDDPTPYSQLQRIILTGGGFAGRLVPTADQTLDESADGGDFDHEGRNGGWVLPPEFANRKKTRTGMPLPESRLVGYAAIPRSLDDA